MPAWSPDGETSIGRDQGPGLPLTSWGMVAGLQGAETAAFEALALRYWRPIYRYIRARWGRQNDDAKELTQAFLGWLLEGDALRRYAPDRGRFRTYLKLLLGRFVSHEAEARERLKRGGKRRVLPLADDAADRLEDPAAIDPEVAFDKAWLAEAVRQALDRVRAECLARGRESHLAVYEAYELAEGPRPTYAQVAARLGVSESDVRNRLHAVRDALRRELRAELRETTSGDPAAVEAEWRELCAR